MEAILSFDADINLRNNLGEFPLQRLVADVVLTSQSYMEMISGFLNHEPDVTSPMRNGISLLAEFLAKSDILSREAHYIEPDYIVTGYRCLEQFLKAGADPNLVYRSKPLVYYCLETCEFREDGPWKPFLGLLFKKANLHAARHDGNYALHVALSRRKQHYRSYRTRYYEKAKAFPHYMVVSSLLIQNVNVNQTNGAGVTPLEIWLTGCSNHIYDLEVDKVALLLLHSGAQTTTFTSTGKTMFDLLTRFSKQERTCLTKEMLKADINSRGDDADTIERPEWAEIWRLAWRQGLWHLAKSHLAELERHPSRPKLKEFNECAFLALAESLLERHKAKLRLWQSGEVGKDSVKEDYEEYCAILRDCRDRNAEVDLLWYTYLLDLMDFNRDLS